MLETDMRDLIRKREQEIVVIVVMRPVELVRLLHERLMQLQLLGRDLEILGFVGEDVEPHRHFRAGIQIDALEILACEHRRIDQRFKAHRIERDASIAGRSTDRIERAGELPAGRQLHARRERDAARVVPGGIERDRVPLQIQHIGCHHDAALCRILRRQKLEFGDQLRRALRYVQSKRVDVGRIARPCERLTVDREGEACKLVDRSARRVVAGKPLRIEQRQLAAADRNFLADAKDAVIEIGGVDRELQCAGIFDVGGDGIVGADHAANEEHRPDGGARYRLHAGNLR